jgi:hypothetical protein
MMAVRGLRPWRAVLCSAGVLGLGACGGIDTAEPPAAQVAAPAVVVSQANAARVAAEALQAVATSLASVRASEGTGSAAAAGIASRKALVARALAQAGGVTAQASRQDSFNCPGGGSATVTLTAAALAVLQAGDTLDFVFSFCKEGAVTTNGALKLKLVSIDTAATGGTKEVYDTVATNLDQTAGGVLERLNGAVRVTFDNELIDTRIPGQVDTLATSTSSTMERRINGASKTTRTLQDLNLLRQDVDGTKTSASFVSFTATGTFPGLGEASFKVSTITAIIIPAGTFQPTSGEIQVVGANGTNLIIRIGADTVLLEIDTDGNGKADATVQRTWAQVFTDL